MASAPPFFLVPGGPFHGLVRRIGLARGDARDVWRLSFAFGFLPWLGLVLLGAVHRILSGSGSPLLEAPSVHVRLLVAIPAFFLAERSLHDRTKRCIERLERFVDPSDERYPRALRRALLLRDAAGPELLVLSVVLAVAVLNWIGVESIRLGAGQSVEPDHTALVAWYGLVTLPIFQFLALRWLWHWVLWTLLLGRISTLRLRMIASHPDRRGGLGFLSEPAVGFAYVLFGLSSVGAAGKALGIQGETFDPASFSWQVMGPVLVGLTVALGPLLLFALPLFRARFAGLRAYDDLGVDYTASFEKRWMGGADRTELLGTSDIQSLADLTNSLDVVRAMRIVPFDRQTFAVVIVAVLAPWFIMLATKVPLVELFQDFANSLFGQKLF